MPGKVKTAIIYDWIDKWGGVERLLMLLHQIFPQADFYTSSYNKHSADWAKKLKIATSFIQSFPNFIKMNRILCLPFYSFAFESFNFSRYDLVISVTSSYAKCVITKPETKHVCILLTPNRFLWVLPDIYLSSNFRFIYKPFQQYLKNLDLVASARPDNLISISKNVADRCFRYYHRTSEVVYPGFDTDYWQKLRLKADILKRDYFLIVSRLEKYKKVDLAIEAFNRRPSEKLIIIGKGSQVDRLRAAAFSNIHFISKVTDSELARFYSNALALIMPQEEDFGYVSLEAQFFGCPVIALRRGGACETVIEGKTGIFFDEQSVDGLLSAIDQFHTISYNLLLNIKDYGEKNVASYDQRIFKQKILKICQVKNK